MPTTVANSGYPFRVLPVATRIAMAVKNEEFIADAVCPRVPVAGELFEYSKVSTKSLYQTPDDLIGRTGAANQIEFDSYNETDRTEDHGLESPVPQKDVDAAAAAGLPDPRNLRTEQLTQTILRLREIRVGTLMFTAGNYPAAQRLTLDDSGAGKYRWDNASYDPIDMLMTTIAGMVVRPNMLTLGEAVWIKLRGNAKTISRLYGTASTRGTARAEDLAAELGLDAINIGKAFRDTANKGQAVSMARIWGNYAALHRTVRPVASDMAVEPCFAFTAQFGNRESGTYFDPKRGKRGVDVLKVTESVKELISWSDAGYLFTTPVTP